MMTARRDPADRLWKGRRSKGLPVTAGERAWKQETTLRLMWRKFRRHRVAQLGGLVLGLLLVGTLCAPFIAPYAFDDSNLAHSYLPPQRVRFVDDDGTFHWRPFTYNIKKTVDMATLSVGYTSDTSVMYPVHFFARGWRYSVFGLFTTDIHLFGVEDGGTVYLLGTDREGRDLFSRILFGGRLTFLIVIAAGLLSGLIGAVVGAISGYLSGIVDIVIQRIIEVFLCLPTLPLWMALSAALPRDWKPIQSVYAIAAIYASLGWASIAREVRGKVLSLRQEDYVIAAVASGAGPRRIIVRHVLPQVVSHVIVAITAVIPNLIMGESTLSFLGLGVQPPMATWGSLLQRAQDLQTMRTRPWIMIPGIFIVITVLAVSFLGDGLRDAADPYSHR